MTYKDIQIYESTKELCEVLDKLDSDELLLDCGHLVTLNELDTIDVKNHGGIELRIICMKCGH